MLGERGSRRQRGVGLGRDHRHQALAAKRIIDAEHRRIGHARMLFQHHLDRFGMDIAAGGDNHAVSAANDVEKAAGIEKARVANRDRPRECTRELQCTNAFGQGVPQETERAFDEDLADLSCRQRSIGGVEDMHPDAGKRAANGRGRRPLAAPRHGHVAELGGAVELDELGFRED